MHQNNKQVYHLLLFISILVFIVSKVPALSLPYFWDELGVYSRAAMYLAENGLGLLPSCLPPELSRGHPLLFSFIYGIGYKLFGCTVLTGHIISLAISVSLLFSVYVIGSRLSNRLTGWLSTVLLMVQPVFFAQSVFVLPEVMLALCSLWALYHCYKRNWFWFAVCASLGILVKESAIVLPAVAIAYMVVLWIFNRNNYSFFNFKSMGLIVTPWIMFGIFLLVQKVQNGWYFFPLHIGSVSFSLDYILYTNHTAHNFLFYHQARYWWAKVFLVVIVVIAIKSKWHLRPSFVLVGLLYFIAFDTFCSVNFYMDRYMLPLLPVFCYCIVAGLGLIWRQPVFVMAVVALLSMAGVREMNKDAFNYDVDMSYTQMLDVEQKAVAYINKNIPAGSVITADFPVIYALSLNNTGFVYTYQHNILLGVERESDYAITEAIGTQSVDTGIYAQVATFEDGYAWLKVWKRKE